MATPSQAHSSHVEKANAYQLPQHRFRDFEIGDDAVFHGPNGHNIARSAPQHPLGFFSDG